MDGENFEYFQKRAEEELALAQRAEHASAVRAHYLMAGYYLDRIHGGDGRGTTPDPPVGEPNGTSVLRRASETFQMHGELAPDYVTARIGACRAAGDERGAALWEQVLYLIENAPLARPRPA